MGTPGEKGERVVTCEDISKDGAESEKNKKFLFQPPMTDTPLRATAR
jgi:hypothetical protein